MDDRTLCSYQRYCFLYRSQKGAIFLFYQRTSFLSFYLSFTICDIHFELFFSQPFTLSLFYQFGLSYQSFISIIQRGRLTTLSFLSLNLSPIPVSRFRRFISACLCTSLIAPCSRQFLIVPEILNLQISSFLMRRQAILALFTVVGGKTFRKFHELEDPALYFIIPRVFY